MRRRVTIRPCSVALEHSREGPVFVVRASCACGVTSTAKGGAPELGAFASLVRADHYFAPLREYAQEKLREYHEKNGGVVA